MAERQIIIDHMRLAYEGLFDVTQLYTMVQEWFREKGYDKKERKNIETITPSGKFIELELEPWKKITDYAKFVIKIRMIMTDIKEVEVEREGVKTKLNQGKIQMVFDAFLETDYEHRWEQKPTFFFIRTLFDKFVFKPYVERFKARLIAETNQLYNNIKGFLNLYRYSTEAWTAPGTVWPSP